jgi:hypothetical protein
MVMVEVNKSRPAFGASWPSFSLADVFGTLFQVEEVDADVFPTERPVQDLVGLDLGSHVNTRVITRMIYQL